MEELQLFMRGGKKRLNQSIPEKFLLPLLLKTKERHDISTISNKLLTFWRIEILVFDMFPYFVSIDMSKEETAQRHGYHFPINTKYLTIIPIGFLFHFTVSCCPATVVEKRCG